MDGSREKVCAGCGATAPPTRTETSLVSTLGWRLRRFTDQKGDPEFEWRCPGCWAEMKRGTSGSGPLTPHAPLTRATQRVVEVVPRPVSSVPPVPDDRDTEKAISLATAPQRDRGALTVLTGIMAGRLYALENAEVVIGRAPDADIWLEEASISRRHARVVRRGDTVYTLEDIGSTNGTFVGGAKIQRRDLASGDQIQLGPNLIFRFAVLDAAELSLQRRLYESSTRDALTRAFNRKYLHERLAQEVAHARRHNQPIAVLMMDLDQFKTTNDTYGHLAGDAVLRSVAELVHNLVRIDDVFARYGGEEFVVLARAIEQDAATMLAERLRTAIEGRKVQAEGKTISVTVSIGVASLSDMPGEAGALELLSLADARLYRAKEAGRNRVCAEG